MCTTDICAQSEKPLSSGGKSDFPTKIVTASVLSTSTHICRDHTTIARSRTRPQPLSRSHNHCCFVTVAIAHCCHFAIAIHVASMLLHRPRLHLNHIASASSWSMTTVLLINTTINHETYLCRPSPMCPARNPHQTPWWQGRHLT